MKLNKEQIRNAFYSQAIADGMGERFEFKNPTMPEVSAFINSDKTIHITDDTQMAMFGQEAMNRRTYSYNDKSCIQSAYLGWYETQQYKEPIESNIGLTARPEMYQRRAPGGRCLSSLQALWCRKTPDTKDGLGCGPVMRLLPFAAIYNGTNEVEVRRLAEQSCLITHGHTDAIKATDLYVSIAIFLMNGGNRHNLRFGGDKVTDWGKGWIAPECVSMAAWSVQHALNYDHMLRLAITHDGDSDSVAAVAGSLWGLAGLGGWERHLPRLAEKDAIDSLFA